MKEEATGECKILHEKELHNSRLSSIIIRNGQIKVNEMAGDCGAHGRDVQQESLKEGGSLEDVDVDAMLLLKLIMKRQDEGVDWIHLA